MKKITLILLAFLLVTTDVWASYPNYTVMPSGGDFNTLQGAVNDLVTNHPVPSTPVTITISGTWASADTTNVNINGLTLTSSNTLTITATGSSANPGYWSNNSPYYRLIVNNNDGIEIQDNYVTIQGVQVKTTISSGYNGRAFDITDGVGQYITLDRDIGISTGTGADLGLRSNAQTSPYGPFYYINSVFESSLSSGAHVVLDSNGGYLANDVFISLGSSNGIGSYNTLAIKNSYAYTASGSAAYQAGNTLTNCASSDTSGSASLQNIPFSTSTFANVTSGSENFSLVPGALLIAAGTNLSGSFTDDIVGNTRQASGAWDIGAFLYATASVTTSTVFGNVLLNNWTQNHG